MSEEGTQGRNTADPGKIHERYSAYRQTGWALSATIIGFSTVLLVWAVQEGDNSPKAVFYTQAFAALSTIAIAFTQQLCYYQGAKHSARVAFGQSTKQHSDWWFLLADFSAVAACVFLFATALASVWLWSARIPSSVEITVYPVQKATDGRALQLKPTVYRLDTREKSVIYWTAGVDDAPRELSKCAIRDAENWRCEYPDGGGTVVMENGRHRVFLDSAVRPPSHEYVTREEWEKAQRVSEH